MIHFILLQLLQQSKYLYPVECIQIISNQSAFKSFYMFKCKMQIKPQNCVATALVL